MACNSVSLATIDARCDTSIGGIKEILIAQRDDVKMSEITINSDGLITNIECVTGKKFEKWQFRKNTGSYTSNLETDPAIGNSSITTDVALQFSRAEAGKRLNIQSAINASAVVLIHDMYDQYLFLGLDNDVNITACTMQSGTANSDLSGFTLTFQDVAQELPHFVKTGEGGVDIADLLVAAE